MSVIEQNPFQSNVLQPLEPVTLDLYRDVHKGIRSELFALTTSAGQVDASDRAACSDLAAHVNSVFGLLVVHAEHEDTAIQPTIEQHFPDLAARIEREHVALEVRVASIDELAAAVGAGSWATRAACHRIYIELAAFTSAYLAHQDLEERIVMPALEQAIGVDAVVGIHGAIIGSIPPSDMAKSMSLMLPAMNVDDRTEMLGGMQAGAPAEAFAAMWSLAGSILSPCDLAVVATRIGLA